MQTSTVPYALAVDDDAIIRIDACQILEEAGFRRGEYAVEAGEMRARWRDQCRQLGDEVHRIPFDMRGAIAPL